MCSQLILWIKRYKGILGLFLAWLIHCLPQNVYTLIIYFYEDFEKVELEKNDTTAIYPCFPQHDSLKEKLGYGIRGIFVLIVGIFGIISNMFCILVLQRLSIKSGFNKLLLSLGTSNQMNKELLMTIYDIIGVLI